MVIDTNWSAIPKIRTNDARKVKLVPERYQKRRTRIIEMVEIEFRQSWPERSQKRRTRIIQMETEFHKFRLPFLLQTLCLLTFSDTQKVGI